MKLGPWILGGALAAAAAAGGWLYFGRGGDEQTFVTTPVRRGPIASVVAATGTVNPVITVTVGSQVSGQVASLHADFNSIVRKGQVIAKLDPSNLDAQVSRDRANLASATAGLERARVEAENAARGFERAKNLSGQSLLAESDYDAAESLAASAAASVKTALAAVEEAKASLRISEVNLAHATIVSPVDGIVISRTVDVGQTVAASLQAPTLFTIAQDLRRMEVHMNVAESDIGRLAIKQDASFTVDAYPQEKFRGVISEIRNSPTTIQNVVTYEAVIGVDNSDLRLKPGMTANVSVTVARKENALLVPNAALRFKPPEAILAKEAKSTGQQAQDRTAGGASAVAGTSTGGSEPKGSNAGGAEARPGGGSGSPTGGAESAARGEGGEHGRNQRSAGSSSRGWSGPRREGSGGAPRGREAQTSPSADAAATTGSPGAGAMGSSDAGATGSPRAGQGRAEGRSQWGPQGRSGRTGPSVWLLAAETPRRVPVTVGITDGSWTEVLSGEIKENDPVITELSNSAAAAAAAARTTRPGFGRMF